MTKKQKYRRKNNSLKTHADKKREDDPYADQIIYLVKNVKEQIQNPAGCRAGRNIDPALDKTVRQFAEHRRRADYQTEKNYANR